MSVWLKRSIQSFIWKLFAINDSIWMSRSLRKWQKFFSWFRFFFFVVDAHANSSIEIMFNYVEKNSEKSHHVWNFLKVKNLNVWHLNFVVQLSHCSFDVVVFCKKRIHWNVMNEIVNSTIKFDWHFVKFDFVDNFFTWIARIDEKKYK